jgi:hypothetical protein
MAASPMDLSGLSMYDFSSIALFFLFEAAYVLRDSLFIFFVAMSLFLHPSLFFSSAIGRSQKALEAHKLCFRRRYN